MFHLDPEDSEWEDKMIYPYMDYWAMIKQGAYWMTLTGFFVYNWNTIMGNRRLRVLKFIYPPLSVFMLSKIYYDYSSNLLQVDLFDQYVSKRAKDLFEENKYMFQSDYFKKYVYFQEDLKESLEKVHRQANDHKASDFADSELML